VLRERERVRKEDWFNVTATHLDFDLRVSLAGRRISLTIPADATRGVPFGPAIARL
jgi:hypothetical protein